MVTANCVPLIYADILANNGVVHVVDSLLPSADQSLQELILSRRELSTFATSIISTLTLIITRACERSGAERSGRFCRSALNLIFLTSAHRSVPAPRPLAHASLRSTRVLARSAPFPLRSQPHTCHKLSRKQWPIRPTCCIVL